MMNNICKIKIIRRRRLLYLLALATLVTPSDLWGQISTSDRASARAATQAFNAAFDTGNFIDLYNNFAGDFVRSKVTQQAFIAQLSILRNNLGGAPRSRQIIQEQSAPDPATGQTI